MNFENFIFKLKSSFLNPLPGHSKFRDTAEISESPKLSAVLICLYPEDDKIYFPMILRPKYEGSHGGQIAFPGGKVEKQDKNLFDTAKRETFEEVGISQNNIHFIGKLSEVYIPPSNYLVSPFVAYVNETPSFIPDPKEVEDIINIEWTKFIKMNLEEREIKVQNKNVTSLGFQVDNYWVWGASALMLAELKLLVCENNLVN